MSYPNFRASLAVVCTAMLLFPAPQVMAQDQPEPQQYKLVIIRGDNAQNNIKKGRATRPVVEVRDRNNKPVAGIAVTFLLPGNGPSGTFIGGGQSATVTTNAAGQASTSFTPNTVTGNYNINVSANVNGQSLTAQIATVNVAGAAVAASTVALIVAAIAAAGVGTAVAVTNGGGGNNNNGGGTAPGGIRIGAGTGTVGPPR